MIINKVTIVEERTMMAQLGQNINTKHYIFRIVEKSYFVIAENLT
jgi:hypothetical protein